MANNNETEKLEQFARNICKEKNIDFDKDFANFMNNFKQVSTILVLIPKWFDI